MRSIGGSNAATELAGIVKDLSHVRPITNQERQQRRDKASALMQQQGIAALVLSASTSLYYFTGLSWYQSERLVGAVMTNSGKLIFVSPAFEDSKLRETLGDQADIRLWEEDENPYTLVAQILKDENLQGKVALDEAAPFFIADGLGQALSSYVIVNAMVITAECRMHKSANEIALMQAAKNITLEVQRRTAKILREGISSAEVADFINQAHRAFGGSSSTFCIVSFGLPTSIPHGPDGVQYLKEGDMVLIDTGCMVERYHSDITRSYVFGEPTARQRSMWDLEKAAQAAAFEAAQIGVPCEVVDAAARRVLEAAGLGPGYKTPGLPHRTGHGIGLDIHEWTYLVKGNKTPLAAGMCFSNEPMICLDGEFGIRLEDHFYMTEQGPKWFTGQSHAVDAPFGVSGSA
ncbi:M24 family metallopeptidase [Undibacterium baiyunense]|uniref:Aminopeptidase P family protein n=1 Tax=Undibacterium baiyunense TaxID=2828731 RepID=A0A941DGI8_9BURK|nr:Xaa-Pro peptidase family protein [Undibacterium baiyunense]MBR7748359.1 aminopeptidase P family protein [Undibacterium baiyunense]